MDRCFTILYLFGQNLFRASAGGLKLLSLQRFKTLYSITLASVLYLDFNQISMFSFWLRLGIKPYLFLCCTFLILDLQYGECVVSSGLKTWFLLLLILWLCYVSKIFYKNEDQHYDTSASDWHVWRGNEHRFHVMNTNFINNCGFHISSLNHCVDNQFWSAESWGIHVFFLKI